MRTPKTRAGRAEHDISQAVTTVYRLHYRSLVRLAALLVSDLATAEDIVQESFTAWHGMRRTLPDADAALCYLRRSVVRRSRSAPRLQLTGGPPGRPGDAPEASLSLPGSAVVSALRALPVRQREVLVLRYFADLPEAQIAAATGISTAAVRSHAVRALSALHAGLRPGSCTGSPDGTRPAESTGQSW